MNRDKKRNVLTFYTLSGQFCFGNHTKSTEQTEPKLVPDRHYLAATVGDLHWSALYNEDRIPHDRSRNRVLARHKLRTVVVCLDDAGTVQHLKDQNSLCLFLVRGGPWVPAPARD